MFDYEDQITDFIKANFNPGLPDTANLKFTNDGLLEFLFDVFPRDCINDYSLNNIMISLGYARFSYLNVSEFGTKSLAFGWCLICPFDLTNPKGHEST